MLGTDYPPPTEDGWYVIEQLDTTGMPFNEAKPLVESLASAYTAQGKRVKIVAKSIVEIMVASDA